MPEIDRLLKAYIDQIQETIRRAPDLDHDETTFTAQRLSMKTRRGKYPKDVTYQILAKVVTVSGHKLVINQHDHARKNVPFLITAAKYMCFDPDDRPCWRLESPRPDVAKRHFQKKEHEYIRVAGVDVQRLTSIDMIEIFLRFCRDGITLDRLREAELNERSWERFPQS